jgi:hypothetical protein
MIAAMWHPFHGLAPTALGWLLLVLMVGCVVLFVRLETLARRLKTSRAPWGIVSLELALSAEEAQDVISSWEPAERANARRHLILDYWFIPFYTTALAILGVIASRWFAVRGLSGMSTLAVVLAWGQWLAGLLDFVCNSALLRMLQTHPEIPQRLPHLAGWCARAKFLLIMLAVGCCLFGLLTSLV